MKRYFLSVVVVVSALSLFSDVVYAQEQARQFIDNIFGRIGNKIIDDIESGIDKSKKKKDRRAAERATLTAGYCQIWKAEKLTVQRRCNSTNYCTDQNCTFKYIWPNGRATRVIMQNSTPVALNGMPTSYSYVGDDACFVDGRPTRLFCFTAIMQPPNLFTRYSAPVITQTPVQTTRIPVQTNPEPVPTSANSENVGFSSLIDEYISASENLDDPNSRKERCNLGGKLLFMYGSSLDTDAKSTIKEQLKNDNCLG